MKNYTVSDIAERLKVNPETVRRWIRSGKLKAEQNSRKEGNTITKAELTKFIKCHPKYYSINRKHEAFIKKKETKMVSSKDAREAVITNGWMNHEVKKYLLSLIKAEEQRRQPVREGDIVRIADKTFVVAKIFDFTDYYQVDPDNPELLAVLYDPIKKTLGFAWEGLYTDPSMCEIISHIDPKQIFREDIKI